MPRLQEWYESTAHGVDQFGVFDIDSKVLLAKVEKHNTMNDHDWCTRLRMEWLLCGPKMDNWKSGGPKGYSDSLDIVIGRIGHILHHVGSLLGGNDLTVLCAFIAESDILMLKIKEPRLYK